MLSEVANGDDPLVLVNVLLVTTQRVLVNEIGKSKGSFLTTPPRLSFTGTSLPALGGVDAEQPNALAVDFDGITIDDGGSAYDVRLGSGKRAGEESSGYK